MTNSLYDEECAEWDRCFEQFRRNHGFDLRETQVRVIEKKPAKPDRTMATTEPNPPWIDNSSDK